MTDRLDTISAKVREAMQQAMAREAPPQTLHFVPGGDFAAQYVALEQLWDGVIPTNRLIALTSQTGHGKTAISTALELHMGMGRTFAGRDVHGGKVLSLVGENPDDKRMRMIATAQHMGVPLSTLNSITVVPDVFDIGERFDELWAAATMAGGVSLVTVDTSAAFYLQDEENDNVGMRRHASMLRELTTLPGNPAVLVLCHPTKSAGRDNLLPRGGGAFLAEIDGNLTAWKDDTGIVTLHWGGKFRGPGFDPIKFELKPVELQGYKDARGRPVHSVVAVHMADERAEELHAKAVSDEDTLLVVMHRNPGKSLRDLAAACGWVNGMGKPQHRRVEQKLERMDPLGLVTKDRKGTWNLTNKGKEEASRVR